MNHAPLLLVEDIPNILDFLAMTLRFKGYEVVTARNGQEAWEILQQLRPALVITDILMPRMDGFALVYRLRSDPQRRDIPVIFLSATYITPEDQAFAMRLGAARFIEKPVDIEEFLLTVAELIQQGPPPPPEPLEERLFYEGYRDRLENKLRQKTQQIARTERILAGLPAEQKPAFEELLRQALADREEVESELDKVKQILEQFSQTP
uniref:Histidine kinase n=1 Tax=uncultured Chloroflexota bacterium TaxID=166587 RepID=H5SMU9_9CHLR|nr:histidine kinase [uncultured Chloroflexota bacterium]